ncbi:MAG: hypothetical protein KGD65_05230 [Candidatus Lokiarchaeota archaeon]|nr:hypothetical protein [Candidatus Lokiarchaeota archaeon]
MSLGSRKPNSKYKIPVIVKIPKEFLEKESPSCPVCGKLFKNLENLNDHVNNLKKQDGLHQDDDKDKLNFELGYREKNQVNFEKFKSYFNLKFGKINSKKKI